MVSIFLYAIVVIRIYIDKPGKSKNPMFETRMEILEKSVSKHMKRIENGENHDLVEINHLPHDED